MRTALAIITVAVVLVTAGCGHRRAEKPVVPAGFKTSLETGEDYWISGPKRRGGDALYGGSIPIEIDDDVREEYWRDIRGQPERIHEPVA